MLQKLWIPNLSIAKIIQDTPETCSSLEFVVRQPPLETYPPGERSHLCVFIRRFVPQLQTLRLILPRVCPESFGTVLSQSATSTPQFTPVGAPKLQDCVVRLASPTRPKKAQRFDGLCNPDVFLSGAEHFAECLLALIASEQAPRL
ncbi:hypothetical protein F4782DRAFT_523902 [Xylaria castorea]|nr:hypothetical protein F4782DRAFT_523902 [Xylaria castorea]